MPEQYLRIKESELKSGKPLKEAERIAAATYNKTHKSHPVGRNSDFAAQNHLHEKIRKLTSR